MQMRQCELEKVIREKGNFKLKRTGEKLVAFVDGITLEMIGSIVDLKKIEGLWVVDKIHEQDIEKHQIKRSWHVGGL
jgi:hypothetical protein